MPGIFGDLFDFDGDGKLNCVEQAAELVTLERMTRDDAPSGDRFTDDEDDDDFTDEDEDV